MGREEEKLQQYICEKNVYVLVSLECKPQEKGIYGVFFIALCQVSRIMVPRAQYLLH